MAIITIEHVMQHLGDVTPEQIGKCRRDTGPDGKECYFVENERGDRYDGQVITYTVRYSPIWGFKCTCPSGANGFYNVHHKSRVCKHCRWVVCCILEERGYMKELAAREESHRETEEAEQPTQTRQARPAWYNPANETSYADGTRAHLLLTGEQEADDATYARVVLAHPYPWTEEQIRADQERYAPRPFKIIDED